MTDEEKRVIRNFETRVRSLLLRYQDLQNEVNELKDTISEKEEEIERLKSEIGQCKDDYDHLKMARMIEINDGDILSAKARITRMVREVNKCIALLSIGEEDTTENEVLQEDTEETK